MELSATSYRILKFLRKKDSGAMPDHNEIIRGIGCKNREDLNNALSILSARKLIDGSMTHASINPVGAEYIDKLQSSIENSAYEYVSKNYPYCVIKFLYENDWGVRIGEFPLIIKKKAPDREMYPEGNLTEYLYNQREYIEDNNSEYKLNDEGIRHYFIETEIINNIKKESKTGDTHYHAPVDKSTKIIGDGNSVAQDSDLHNALVSPMIDKHSSTTPRNPKRSLIEILSWIVGIVAGSILIYEFFIKK